jgi:hypothetical protein
MVPLSRLTSDQAEEVGIDNVEELKRLRQQWKKDKKTTRKLRDGYKKIVARSSLVIPLGSEAEFDIQDGVCIPKSISSRFYNSKSGQVNTFPVSSRERCEKIKSVYQRHRAKIVECGDVSRRVNEDYFKEVGMSGMGGFGSADGSSVGGAVHGSMLGGAYPAGGLMGGYLAGGMGGGMYPGGGFGMGMYGSGSDLGFIQGQSMMCEYLYEFQNSNSPRSRPAASSEVSGSGAGVQTQQQ